MSQNDKIKFRFNFKKSIIAILITILFCAGCDSVDSHHAVEQASESLQQSVEQQPKSQLTKQQPELQSVSQSTEESEASESEQVSIVMVGDVLLHTPINESARQEDGSYDYSHLFAHVKQDIQAADIAIVNQEVILGGAELGLSGYPAFNSAYEAGDALADAGFDVVLHATNHALDRGKQGILNCLAYWREQQPQMKVVGIYDSAVAQESKPCIIEQNGMKIAILNYTYGTNGIPLPADMPYAVNLLDQDRIRDDVERAKEEADFVIVCPHWGTEYSHEISDQQKKYAQFFADLGVDLVIGTHPHVIEPVAWIESETADDASADETHRTLVYYSLGNFINATSGSGRGVADRMVGAMACVTLTRSSDDKVVIDDYGVEPLVTQMLTGKGRITTYKLSDYTQELEDENEVLERDGAFSYQYCVDLCSEIFGDLYQQEH